MNYMKKIRKIFHSYKAKKKQFGFLLLEAILAITIISVGSAAIMRTYAVSLAAGVVSQQYVVASSLVEKKIWEVLSLNDISSAQTTGAFPEPFNNYSFNVSVEERLPETDVDFNDMTAQEDSSGVVDEQEKQEIYILYTIEVTVLWEYRGDKKELSYETATIRKQKEEDMNDLAEEL